MPYQPWESGLTQSLQSVLPHANLICEQYLGQHFLSTPPDHIPDVIGALQATFAFDFLVDITAVDYPAATNPERLARFDLVYFLYSFPRNERICIRTQIADTAPSITSLFAGADWLEREVFDMFGIRFAGHPHLKRILLPEDWVGHPLRKEYPIAQPDAAWVAANLEML